jgi:DNA invertase Pin-like site-specific DNA recombinase
MTDTKRVAVYSRVARENPVALDAQERDCADWAQRHGMEVTESYRSVGPDDRLLDLMNDIAAGKVDAVVATKSSRYSRRVFALEVLTSTARKHGVQVFTVELDDLDLTSAVGDHRLTMQTLFTDYETERAQAEERVRKSRE